MLAIHGGAAAAEEQAEPGKGFELDASAEAIFAAGNNEFAPYYIMSNNHGILTQNNDALLRLSAEHKMQRSGRFSYGFGLDFLTGYSSSTPYLRFSPDAGYGTPVEHGWLVEHSEHPARIWLQQLYGEIRYRSLFLTAGLKQHHPALLSPTLSSGDLIESGNSRPIPEVRAGFIDFQDIPFTNGWVQIQGEISYGKMTDNKWLRNHYDYYSYHLNQGALYSYKRCYLRTNPSKPFSFLLGMQVGSFFGGETTWYMHGIVSDKRKFSSGVKQFFRMLVPTDGGLDYYSGSSLGNWDIHLRYRLRDGSQIKAYLQKLWEDGSGIGFQNGFDGLWGIQYDAARPGLISSAVIEYLDFTNQGGPIHWSPEHHPGTPITTMAAGNDNYYNNHEYNSYANYGMAIGSPFLVSPIYNTSGYPAFIATRVRGFHIGVEGEITDRLSYRLLGGYRRSWGTCLIPFAAPRDNTSFLVEASYRIPRVEGLSVKGAFSLDHGELLGNRAGGLLTIKYAGKIFIK